MARVPRALVTMLLVVTPLAAAAPAAGLLEAEGGWALPAGAQLGASSEGAWLADATGILALHGSAARARVSRFETVGPDSPLVQVAPQVGAAAYDLTAVSLALAAPVEGGWLGIPPHDARLSFVAGSRVSGAASPPQAYGDGTMTAEAAQAPDTRAFAAVVDRPHVAILSSGELTLQGDFALKFQGPDLALGAAENSSRLETGEERPADNPLFVEHAWAFLELTDATLVVSTATPLVLPAGAFDATWDGPLEIQAASGAVRTDEASYTGGSRPAVVDGAFEGRFGAASSTATHIDLRGDLVATTLVAAPDVGVGATGGGSAWLPWALAAVLAGGGGGAAYALVRRRASRGGAAQTPEEFAHRAGLAAEAGAFDEALRWVEEGLRVTPGSSRLMVDRGFFLERLGETEAALAAYAAASQGAGDGEPEFLSYLLHRRLGDEAAAERWLLEALARAPSLALEVEGDLDRLSARARAAVLRALRSLRR